MPCCVLWSFHDECSFREREPTVCTTVCMCGRQPLATTPTAQLSATTTRQSQSNVDQLCAGDDEDCTGSSGAEDSATIVTDSPSTLSTSTAVVARQQVTSTHSLENEPSPTRPPAPTRRGDRDGQPPPGPLSAAPHYPDVVTPGQRYSSQDGQNQQSSSSMAAISMNIILIVGIAAAFVVLLLILIFAVCAYTRQRPAAVSGRPRPKATSGKVDNKGYAYEACNTSPPMPIATAPVVLNACNYQPVPGAPYSTMSMTFQPMSPDMVDTKPASKKDVKEWYVWGPADGICRVTWRHVWRHAWRRCYWRLVVSVLARSNRQRVQLDGVDTVREIIVIMWSLRSALEVCGNVFFNPIPSHSQWLFPFPSAPIPVLQ